MLPILLRVGRTLAVLLLLRLLTLLLIVLLGVGVYVTSPSTIVSDIGNRRGEEEAREIEWRCHTLAGFQGNRDRKAVHSSLLNALCPLYGSLLFDEKKSEIGLQDGDFCWSLLLSPMTGRS